MKRSLTNHGLLTKQTRLSTWRVAAIFLIWGTLNQQMPGLALSQGEEGSLDTSVHASDDTTHLSKKLRQEEDDESVPKVSKVTAAPPRDKDEYVPGAVLKVHCQNFLTYESVFFHPGPYLNFVVGANGTGKSTLACAIAIGLGFPPSVLGRATNLKAFVKIGYSQGSVEITLKGKPGQRNLVIKRTLSFDAEDAEDKSHSHFRLNNRVVSHNVIKNAIMDLNVQVGNLCSFLPQDRVASFAALTQKELLVETQKAAGHEKLNEWHEDLIKNKENLKKLQSTANSNKEEHNRLVQRNQMLEREIERYQERMTLLTQATVIRCSIPYRKYHEAKVEFSQFQDEHRTARANLGRIQHELEPFTKTKKNLVRRKNQAVTQKKEIEEKYTQNDSAMKSKDREFQQAERITESLRDELKNLRNSENKRRSTIKQVETEIQRLKKENIKKPEAPPEINENTKAKVVEIKKQLRAHLTEVTNIQSNQKKMEEEIVKKREASEAIDQRLAREWDVSQRKEMALKSDDFPTWKALQFIRENKSLFRDEVLEPIRLEINARKKAYAKQLDACIRFSNQRMIICRNQADYDILARELNERQGLRVNISHIPRTPQYDLAKFKAPLTQDQLKDAGFDCWALDLFDAPDVAKAYLANSQFLHTVAIQTEERPTNTSVFLSEKSSIQRWLTLTTMNTVKWSRFGKKNEQITTRQIPPSNTYSVGVNQARVAEINEEKQSIKQEVEDLTDRITEGREREDIIRTEHEKLTDELNALDSVRQEFLRKDKEWQKHRLLLEQAEDRLQRLINQPDEAVKRKHTREKLEDSARQRIGIAYSYKALVTKAYELMEEQAKVSIRVLQAEQDIEAFEAEISLRLGNLREAESAEESARENMQSAKSRAQAVRDDAERILSEASPEVAAEVQESVRTGKILEKDVAAYETEMESVEARLELCGETRENVMTEYEDRKKKIDHLGERIAETDRECESLERRMAVVRQLWYPELQSLISEVSRTFSSTMERLGCTGEVRVGEKDDYRDWELEILVSFRDQEDLHVLTSHRQSGGERSLATVVYLMSLMRLARAPFSLVDEINQGMDQRAERAVHGEFVEVTCSDEAAGQTFLITPKLLPGLRYHGRMRCLCVNNGEWLPESMDIKALVDRKQKAR